MGTQNDRNDEGCMSSFTITAVSRLTGATYKVDCIDDYFGRHRYGYFIQGLSGREGAMNEKDFYEQFEEVENA